MAASSGEVVSAAAPGVNPNASPARRPHLAALTGLRFVAAFWVVAHHYLPAYLTGAPQAIHNLINSGYVPVTLFFVLSGFVLTYNYAGGPALVGARRSRFWIARAARIYPSYLLAMALVAPFILLETLRGIGLGPVGELATGVLTLTMTHTLVPAASVRWNTPGWSLGAEALFYALFPLLVSRSAGLARRPVLSIVALWSTSLIAPVWYVFWIVPGRSVEDLELWRRFAVYFPVFHLPAFLIGTMIAWMVISRPSGAPGGAWSAAVGLVAVVGGIGLLADDLPYGFRLDGVLAPLFGLVIYGLVLGGGWIGRLLATPLLVLLGEASYALYILQEPAWRWTLLIVDWAGGRQGGLQSSPLYFVGFSLGLTAVSILVFKWIERPARQAIVRRLAA
jgi:peptidoglycan/LPS O-acetylase OafA/YrhL